MKRYFNFITFIVFAFICQPVLAQGSHQVIHHIVMVWFPDNTSQQDIQTVIRETRKLGNIPGVNNLHVGKAISSERKIVDDSFDLGISMQFTSVDSMNTYLQHPKHQEFVKRYIKGKVEKILVYDF